jgi:hypothetical protein
MTVRSIGSSKRDAITWLQDHLRLTRPIAESTAIGLVRDGHVIVNESGISLLMDDADLTRYAKQRYSSEEESRNLMQRGKIIRTRRQQHAMMSPMRFIRHDHLHENRQHQRSRRNDHDREHNTTLFVTGNPDGDPGNSGDGE